MIMNRKHFIYACLCCSMALALGSCADHDMLHSDVDMPETLKATDYLKDYDVLSSYAAFPISVSADYSTLSEDNVVRRIMQENFSELAPSDVFDHENAMKATGKVDSVRIATIAKLASDNGLHLFAGPLVSSTGQNATYLNSLIQPNVMRPDGDDGGYCIKITNSALCDNAKDAQVAYTFAKTPAVEPYIQYRLAFMVRGTSTGTVQCATYSNGKGSNFTPTFEVTSDWTRVELMNTMASGISGLTSVLFNVGLYVGTIYIDDLELVEIDDWGYEATGNLNTVNADLDDYETTLASISIHTDHGGFEEATVSELGEGYDPLATYVEKTYDEKNTILSGCMQGFIADVMRNADGADWQVLHNPIDATGNLVESNGEAALPGEFFWHDYMGKEYAVKAFQYAAQAQLSSALYISQDGMEYNSTLADRLVELTNWIDQQGAHVDGIGMSIDVSTDSVDTNAISNTLAKLAATGKKVRITSLKVDVPSAYEDADLVEQGQLYQTIVKAYMDAVPAAQRGGIVVAQAVDGTRPTGLWDATYSRKHAFGGFVKGLQ